MDCGGFRTSEIGFAIFSELEIVIFDKKNTCFSAHAPVPKTHAPVPNAHVPVFELEIMYFLIEHLSFGLENAY